MYRKRIGVVVVFLAVILSGCAAKNTESSVPTELIVSAAVSLTDSMNEIQSLYEKEHGDIKLVFNFGSSGALQQQIEQGAPSDLFLSAGKKQMKALVDKQLVEESRQTGLLLNELVIVVSTDMQGAVSSVADLAKPQFGKLAIGEPDTVPAGSYAKESLEFYKLWDQLQSKLVYAKDVRQVLTYVETGNADVGFVYKTDAMTSKKVKVASIIDPSSHKSIEYPMGIVKATKHLQEAQDFYDFLRGAEAREIFAKYGFTVPKQ
ncbi:molybdate ABC transporter substrate-binding protein [Cohnella silvisoli]|uniref:Molybdate ABC transporter substrate-binding protein n=1 Tax=Cohnella silvisoli TaxID=2873699 RepID=A0ABV1KPC3_9BACL|nr:molybdate ABC transporter substrate-binding protein [Cohnella silvisoli]MCD9020352.1 molybdate ABC transporter substrate-binding protein [Cohnella silvisoli]